MCPERGRTPPPPTEPTAFIFICVCTPSSAARVTMMESNHLLLYKLLCKDKRLRRLVCACQCVLTSKGGGGFLGNAYSTAALYADCLQHKQCWKVKVILMNSNGSLYCLRQVIHNHSSRFFFFLSCPFLPSLFFFPPLSFLSFMEKQFLEY